MALRAPLSFAVLPARASALSRIHCTFGERSPASSTPPPSAWCCVPHGRRKPPCPGVARQHRLSNSGQLRAHAADPRIERHNAVDSASFVSPSAPGSHAEPRRNTSAARSPRLAADAGRRPIRRGFAQSAITALPPFPVARQKRPCARSPSRSCCGGLDDLVRSALSSTPRPIPRRCAHLLIGRAQQLPAFRLATRFLVRDVPRRPVP